MDYTVTVLMTAFVTHDVRRIIVTKPIDFDAAPGQGVALAINRPEWVDQARPFTPTSLPEDQVLEFTIKLYPQHHGVTEQMGALRPGDELLMSPAFGAITYQGPGTFIAAGAGITPFLAILRQLAQDHELAEQHLLFSNRTAADVICEKELRHLLGNRCHLTLTQDTVPGYDHRRINRSYLEEVIDNTDQHFYVCGPPGFTKAVRQALEDLGANPQALIFDQ